MAPNLITIGIAFLVVFTILTVLYWTLPIKSAQRLQGYLSMISFLSLVTAILGFFITQTNAAKQQQQSNISQGLNFIQTDLLALYRYIDQNPSLAKLWKSINPNNPQLARLPNPTNIDPVVQQYKEIFVAQWMFQIIENFVNFIQSHGYSFSSPSNKLWIDEFRNWFNYPIVAQQWEYSKNKSGQDAVEFVERYVKQRNF